VIRRVTLLLASAALAWVLTGCASNRMNDLADNLKNALAGTPVDVTQQNGSVLLTSSADYMFLSGGWQIPSDSPILNRIVPILSNLHNTKIVVGGYTDNTPVGPQLKRMGVADNV
jgi:chemotaxis protein MotB